MHYKIEFIYLFRTRVLRVGEIDFFLLLHPFSDLLAIKRKSEEQTKILLAKCSLFIKMAYATEQKD
jgi:hypothetical protein